MKEFIAKVKINNESESINVKSRLSFIDTAFFTNSIINEIINLDNANIILYMKDFIIKSKVVEYFTDYPIPDDIEEQFDLIYGTEIYDAIVKDNDFNRDYYVPLIQNINKQIDFELSKIANKSKVDELAEAVMGIVKKIDENFDMAKVSGALEKLQGMEKIDEKSLVKAFMEEKKPRKKKESV